jgi:ribonuclease-3
MVEKRQRPFEDFGNGNHNQSPKRHRPQISHGHRNSTQYSGANSIPVGGQAHSYDGVRNTHGKDNPVNEYVSRLPDPSKCNPCKLAAGEMQNGLLFLLDMFVKEDIQSKGSKDEINHARELHRLLSARAMQAVPSKAQRDLDRTRPQKTPSISIPAYIEHKLEKSTDLPALPPITEPYLEAAVFTHATAVKNGSIRGFRADDVNYERLEFLGDAYLEVIASQLIYSRFPDLETSQQSYLREQLVRNETLAGFSDAYGLGDRLAHGGHISESKGWTKILADVFEAYVAALVLSDPESGYCTAEAWLTKLWAPQMLAHKEPVVENARARDDINKLLMARGIKLEYREEKDMQMINGKQHFFIGLYLTGWGFDNEWLGTGEGRNKAQACVFAAMDALKNKMDVIEVANKRKLEVYPPKPKPVDGANGDKIEAPDEQRDKDTNLNGEKTEGKRQQHDDLPRLNTEDGERKKKKKKKSKE